MFWRLRDGAVPIFFLVLFGLWTAAVYFPLFYSLSFPNHDIQHLVGALEGRESARKELSSFVQNTIDSSGRLNHAIRMAAYYGASAEYKFRQSHTSKETEYAYLAWFEKRPKPVIFVVRLSEIDGSLLRFNMREGEPLGLARVLILPPLAFSFCLYWFRRKHASSGKKLLTNAQIGN
jgi:hypothetical protein